MTPSLSTCTQDSNRRPEKAQKPRGYTRRMVALVRSLLYHYILLASPHLTQRHTRDRTNQYHLTQCRLKYPIPEDPGPETLLGSS